MTAEKITPAFVILPDRAFLRVTGPDAATFLQGLMSNDIDALATSPSLHTAFLTPQGKYLHDAFISRERETYLLDTERAEGLLAHLKKYKLRSKVDLAIETGPVYAVFGAEIGAPDPRHEQMGWRTLTKPDLPELPFAVWDEKRIRFGLADGARDAEIEKSTLEELNMSGTAVSFTKGCYVGQELTARMEMRGLAKKHLLPLSFKEAAPAYGETLVSVSEKPMGEMRSSCGQIGLALIRDDFIDELKAYDDKNFLRLLGQ